VVGKTVTQATNTLKGDGLTVATNTQATTTYAAGTVLKTDPIPGALVKKGNTVTLTVAAPPVVPKTTVPSGITNTDVNSAESALKQAGLQYTVKYQTNNAQQGQVLSSDPASGASINQGAAVTLIVSSGPSNVTVPSVAGLNQAAAGNVLGNRGLGVSGTTSQPSSQYQAGLVISSDPGAGSPVAPNSSVTLIVSSGPPPPTTTTTSTTTTAPGATTTTAPGATTTTAPLFGHAKYQH
jgi:serine/threonine-protein kinase